MAQRPRIQAAAQRISMASTTRIQQAPRIAATPRTRGSKWMAIRQRWLRDNPCCCDCWDEGRPNDVDVEVDHEIPLWAGGADDETNFATRCKPHHKAKTAREAQDRARR